MSLVVDLIGQRSQDIIDCQRELFNCLRQKITDINLNEKE